MAEPLYCSGEEKFCDEVIRTSFDRYDREDPRSLSAHQPANYTTW